MRSKTTLDPIELYKMLIFGPIKYALLLFKIYFIEVNIQGLFSTFKSNILTLWSPSLRVV